MTGEDAESAQNAIWVDQREAVRRLVRDALREICITEMRRASDGLKIGLDEIKGSPTD